MTSFQTERVTGVVYDERLASHYNAWNKNFTETPERLLSSIRRCRDLGLLERCKNIPIRPATENEILTCHSKKHLELMSSTAEMSVEDLKALSQKYDFIYFHQKSYENARLALGGVVDLVDEVASGKIRNGMAIIRPPGHHAMKDEYCGYCYFSNVAIATQLALDKYNLKRVLVLDWDIHHGQGSQFKFYDDPRVLFASIHRYELGAEWPHLRESDYDFIGRGPGKGYNINIPLNEIGCGNNEYMSIFFNFLLPIFYEFDPELVVVSAGYDCALGCPEGEMTVTPACFAHFVNMLTPLASGKIALIMEGGYNLKSLSESVALSLRALLGDPTPKIAQLAAPKPSVVESVLNSIKVLHPYWQCLRYQDLVEPKDVEAGTYPFLRVLHLPPVQDVKFYTPETRPEFFPLLQECANEAAIQQLEKNNRIVDGLIRDTSLSCAEKRLSLAWDKKCLDLHSYLNSRGLWCHCLSLEEVLSGTSSSGDFVKASLDSMISYRAQSSLCLVQPISGQQNGATTSHKSVAHMSNVELATQYATDNVHMKRTLVIELGTSSSHRQMCSMNDPSVLYISMTWPGGGEVESISLTSKKTSCLESEKTDATSNCVDIFIPEGPITDGDLLTTLHQIILPVSYEFCPDLVILSWRCPLGGSEGSSSLLTASGMGHATQLLHGLAQGKLLVLIESEGCIQEAAAAAADYSAMETGDSKVIAECVSILLGGKCGAVAKSLPSSSCTTAIRNLQDNLKDRWKLFQFRHPIPKVQI